MEIVPPGVPMGLPLGMHPRVMLTTMQDTHVVRHVEILKTTDCQV